jgi:hypothetical protein
MNRQVMLCYPLNNCRVGVPEVNAMTLLTSVSTNVAFALENKGTIVATFAVVRPNYIEQFVAVVCRNVMDR